MITREGTLMLRGDGTLIITRGGYSNDYNGVVL